MTSAMHSHARSFAVQDVLVYGTGVAVAWYLLYHLNQWMFASLSLSPQVSWVFLPAAIRMLAVVLFGWAGVLGLFLGALFTNQLFGEVPPMTAVTVSVLSALGPWLAFRTCTQWLNLPDDLSGLKPSHLLILSAVGAFFICVPHCIFFYLSGISLSLWTDLIPMFTGDLVGTLMVLYAASLLIKCLIPRKG